VKLSDLKESEILKKTIKYFILPNLTLGIIAMFVPYAYMLIPVYETDQCYHYYTSAMNYMGFPCFIQIVNLCTFVTVNWVQTFILILLYYLIRNIKDELNIKLELKIIIILWAAF
jgi:hypothetical protein